MTSNACDFQPLEAETIDELKKYVWGTNISEELFLRWTQGLKFSEFEPSALVQYSGGPCAVIAPVQAYIIKNIFFCDKKYQRTSDQLKTLSDAEAKQLLCRALSDILELVSDSDNCRLVVYSPEQNQEHCSSREDGQTENKRQKLFNCDSFHSRLVYSDCSIDNVRETMNAYVDYITQDFGVLSFLYSVLLTKGLKAIAQDVDESAIDPTYGHGGQCIINLLLTGEATSQVFDGEKEAGGLKLRGLVRQSQIGFLSLLETHRLLEVGWNFKSPVHPIWILASEAHLTVLFSEDSSIVESDRQTEALRVIRSYDSEGNGFISTALLGDVLSAINLVFDTPK